MTGYTGGDTRPVVDAADLPAAQANGSLVLDSRRTRPFWFDGRFLAARDFSREQNYFLTREADLARSAGFGAIHGLLVGTAASNAGAVTLGAGYGVTPAGELVTVPTALTLQLAGLTEDAASEPSFGTASPLTQNPSKRSGLFVLALKPVQFTAGSVTAYPTAVQGARGTHDADLVEATAVVLVPYPALQAGAETNQAGSTAAARHAALARAVFTRGGPSQLSESLLPLALLSLQAGVVEWVDTYLVRRESAAGLHFGLNDTALQQGFLLEYDSQLQAAVDSFARQGRPAKFAATDFFQALPPAGRFPLAAIDAAAFTQSFFPAEMDVRLSVVPEDELAGLLEESLSLPPIDLAADPSTWASLSVFALVPVPRKGFAALAAALPAVQLTTVLPQVLARRRPAELLQFYRGAGGIRKPSGADNHAWQAAFGTQTYGYYVRRRSAAPPVIFSPLVALVFSGVSPAAAVAGSPDTRVTLTGSGFSNSTQASWNGTTLATAFVSPTEITATVPAALLAQPGTATILLTGPDQVSPSQTFTVTPRMSVTSLSPATAVAGAAALTLTVTGAAFQPSAVVFWNGAALATTFVSDAVLTAAVTADLLAKAGATTVTVQGVGQVTGGLAFRVTPAPLVLTSISPTSVSVGTPSVQVNAAGSGFTSATQITWNGKALPSTVVSSTLIQATVSANMLAVGSVQVGVAAPGASSPPALTLTVLPPPPQLSSLSPASVVAGGQPFTLAVNGSSFAAGDTILWNGQPLPTTVLSASGMQAPVPASLIASAGTAQVAVTGPGQPTSAALPFTVLAPLTITSLSPASVAAGAGVVPLAVNGTGFTSATVVVVQSMLVTGAPVSTPLANLVVVSSTQITGSLTVPLLVTGALKVVAQIPNGQTSNSVALNITSSQAVLSTATPNAVAAGSQGLTVALTGQGFSTSTVFRWNGNQVAATVSDATDAVITVPASFVAQPGTASITATNGLQASGALTFTIGSPQPVNITGVQPPSAMAGSGPVVLVVSASGLPGNAAVYWNGTQLATSQQSANQLQATVAAALLVNAGTAQLTVAAPGVTSPAFAYPIIAKLAVASLQPSSVLVGAKDFTLTLAGSGFAAGLAVIWKKTLPTGAVSSTPLGNVAVVNPQTATATVPAALAAAVGSATIYAQLGSQISNELPFAVNALIHDPIPHPIPIPNPLPHPLPQVAEPAEQPPSKP